jgi:transposase
LPSSEGWPVVWLWSTLLALHQGQRRRERLSAAQQELAALQEQLAAHRSRKRSRPELQKHIDAIVQRYQVERYLALELHRTEKHLFHQERRGRPGPKTRYRRVTQAGWRLSWKVDEDKIAYDRKSDGMYPLLTNDRTLSPRQVFEAHKHQPTIEKRFSQVKSVFEIAPVFLKNEARIEALFFVYFLALLVQGLIERELRQGMKRARLEELPLYPEERTCRRPTAEQIFRLFSLVQRSILLRDGAETHVFEPELTDLQTQILKLLGVPSRAYRRH